MAMLQTILATLVTLGILVTIHEWGHFFVARRCGVKVLRFSVGFGKPLWRWHDRQGTEYVLAAIPLGGYVRMLDEREAPVAAHLRDQAFNNKPVLQRIAIVAAGPLVNLLFAWFAYWLMFVVGVTAVAPVIGSVEPNSIAGRVGVPVGAELVAIDDTAVRSWEEVNLRLAGRVGESGTLALKVQPPDTQQPRTFQLTLTRWSVDLERESPVAALGIVPFRPPVSAVLGQIVAGGAAEAAGLQRGDHILQVDGEPIADWSAFVTRVQQSPGQRLVLTLERAGLQVERAITPQGMTNEQGESVGRIGAAVQLPQWPAHMVRQISFGPLAAIVVAWDKTMQMIGLTLDSIWKMIQGVISVKNLSGPITIAKVAGASAASGFEPFISFLAYLSISLGVLNLLPIPVLDGGHLLYYTIELIRGKPVSEKVQVAGLKIGMLILFSLMTLAIINDFMRL